MAIEENENKDGTQPSAPDYKALLEKEKADKEAALEKLGKAEFTLKKKNLQDKKKSGIFKKKDADDDEEEEEADDINTVLDAKIDQRLSQKTAIDYLNKHTSNADELELAKFYLENNITPSGNPEFDALAALSIANRPALLKQKEEMKTAIVNKNQTNNASFGGSGGNAGGTEINEFNKHLTPEQLNTLRTTHRMNDKQIQMFIEKRGGQRHSYKP